MKFRLALLITVLVPAPVLANFCAAPQSRSNATISGVVNTYYPVISDIVSGDQIQVGAAFGANEALRVGDIVLLWMPQSMQYTTPSSPTTSAHTPASFGDGVNGTGYTNLNNTGKFQWLRVSGSNGGTSPTGTVVKTAGDSGNTTLTITNGAGQGMFGTLQLTGQTTLRSAQLIRVPQYGNVTISGTVTAEPYRQTVDSGTTGPRGIGGIVALDVAGSTTFSPGSKIDVNGLGFRGGAGQRLDGIATPAITMTNATRWYAHPGLVRPTGGIKGEGGAGTPHRLFYQGAETPNLDYTGTGSISNEGYGTATGGGSAYGRGAPGNGGGGATDQCPYNTNTGISTTTNTMCRINTITYGYSRLNPGGGGG
ncbi:MAG: hypothetical protein Q7J32_03165, partial [Sphingomonadaceae bacterium]|nr:hypothetical protein [Sphingomonadaceae bacterium]